MIHDNNRGVRRIRENLAPCCWRGGRRRGHHKCHVSLLSKGVQKVESICFYQKQAYVRPAYAEPRIGVVGVATAEKAHPSQCEPECVGAAASGTAPQDSNEIDYGTAPNAQNPLAAVLSPGEDTEGIAAAVLARNVPKTASSATARDARPMCAACFQGSAGTGSYDRYGLKWDLTHHAVIGMSRVPVSIEQDRGRGTCQTHYGQVPVVGA